MKFGIGVLYKKLLSKHKFHENRCTEVHTLLKDLNEVLPVFPTFLSYLDMIQYRGVHKNLLSYCEFHEYDSMKAILHP